MKLRQLSIDTLYGKDSFTIHKKNKKTQYRYTQNTNTQHMCRHDNDLSLQLINSNGTLIE